jgi:hypothetical protein
MSKRDTVVLLRLRSAVADKEWTTACANRDLAVRGDWSCDWYQDMMHAQREIEKCLLELEREGERNEVHVRRE